MSEWADVGHRQVVVEWLHRGQIRSRLGAGPLRVRHIFDATLTAHCRARRQHGGDEQHRQKSSHALNSGCYRPTYASRKATTSATPAWPAKRVE